MKRRGLILGGLLMSGMLVLGGCNGAGTDKPGREVYEEELSVAYRRGVYRDQRAEF